MSDFEKKVKFWFVLLRENDLFFKFFVVFEKA